MIWRNRYETQIVLEPRLPLVIGTSLTGDVMTLPGTGLLVGGFSLESLPCCEIWRKLIEEDLGGCRMVLFDVSDLVLESAVPRSRHPVVFTADDAEGGWRAQLGSEDASHGFALRADDGTVSIAMVGLPTEDALDQFCSYG